MVSASCDKDNPTDRVPPRVQGVSPAATKTVVACGHLPPGWTSCSLHRA